MKICRTTDGNFLGVELEPDLKIGDTVSFGDFSFEISFMKTLESGHLTIGSPNYQIELEE